jgi:Fur family transcriptional regulator, peroxide stress response regulator
MSVSREELDRRIVAFSEACRITGVRMTHQRMEVFREVAKTDEHPDAETIYDRVRRRIPAISLDTVYRTLTMLETLGVLSRVYALCDRARFDATVAHHHHFVCAQCGMIRDFVCKEADKLEIPREVQSWGIMKSTHLEVRAICSKCAKRKKAKN